MFLTATDVVLRYFFNRPITGAFEITELMLPILIAFGFAYTAVLKEHIRIDIITSRFSPGVQAYVDSIAALLGIAVFFLITWHSVLYAESLRASGTATPVLGLPIYPIVWVVALGSAMFCLAFLADLLEQLNLMLKNRSWWAQAGLLLMIVVIPVLFALPVLLSEMSIKISPLNAGIVGTCLLIVLLFTGIHIGVVMILVGFLGFAYVINLGPAFSMLGMSPYSTLASYNFSVVPLFILMGTLCFHSGLSKDLYFTMYRWLGFMPGGLAMATIGSCAGFAAVCGSAPATVATIGTVALPEMKRYNYDPSLATGCIAAGGSIGSMIPPSVALIMYAIITEQSIGMLFLAGFLPGLLEAVFYLVTIYILCKRDPLMGPPGEKVSVLQRLAAFKDTWGVFAIFILVIGGIYMGVFTPTEAAGIGAFGALVYAVGKGQLSWKRFTESLVDTGKTTAMAFLILIGAVIFNYFLAVTRLPFELGSFAADLAVNRYIILTAIMLVYLFLGAIMSGLAVIMLIVPIFFPVVVALGFDPIWFGIITVRMMEIGQITPPIGINVFIMKGVGRDIPLSVIYRGILPFLAADVIHIVLLVVFPQISLWLPSMIK